MSDLVPKRLFDEEREKVERLNRENAQLQEKLIERDKVILLLKVRSRIEELEKKFLHPGDRDSTRWHKWDAILRRNTRHYMNNIELRQFRNSITCDFDFFIKTVTDLYGDFSDPAAHKVLFSVHFDRASINQMFANIGMVADEAKIVTVEAIMTPILLSPP